MPHGHVIHLSDRRKELPEECYLQQQITKYLLGTIFLHAEP